MQSMSFRSMLIRTASVVLALTLLSIGPADSRAGAPARSAALPAVTSPAVTMPATPPVLLADRYEPNDTPQTATPLVVGQPLQPLTFWPIGDMDDFALAVDAPDAGRTLLIAVDPTLGPAPHLRVLATDGRVLTEDTDGADHSLRRAVVLPQAGRYILELRPATPLTLGITSYHLATSWQEHAPEPAASIVPTAPLTSTTTTAPVSSTAQSAAPTPTMRPGADAAENNYDFDHATPITVGEPVRNLTFVCPVGDCADNDFFGVTLKGGQCYRFATTDLAPGVDTNLIVYGSERDQAPPLGGNDDVAPGELRSQVDACLPASFGVAPGFVLVGNAANELPPSPSATRTYTLSVTLLPPSPSPTMALPPVPTVTATAVPTPHAPLSEAPPPAPPLVDAPGAAPPAAPVVATASAVVSDTTPSSGVPAESGVSVDAGMVPAINDAPKGVAEVSVATTALHVAPGVRTEVIQTLQDGEQVKLFGQARGAWVRVQPFTVVVPGWVYAADLWPLPGLIAGGQASTTTVALTSTTVPVSRPAVPLTPSPTREPMPSPTALSAVVEREADTPLADSAVPAHLPLDLTVTILAAPATPSGQRGPTPTPNRDAGIASVRVQVVTVFGDVLVEGMTAVDGKVVFSRDVPPATALYVQVPALGLRTTLAPDDVRAGRAAVTIVVPEDRQ